MVRSNATRELLNKPVPHSSLCKWILGRFWRMHNSEDAACSCVMTMTVWELWTATCRQQYLYGRITLPLLPSAYILNRCSWVSSFFAFILSMGFAALSGGFRLGVETHSRRENIQCNVLKWIGWHSFVCCKWLSFSWTKEDKVEKRTLEKDGKWRINTGEGIADGKTRKTGSWTLVVPQLDQRRLDEKWRMD